MTLAEYLEAKDPWLSAHRHPKTVRETRVAVEAFCEWFHGDVDVDKITPKMVEQFEHAEPGLRSRQLASNLLGLLRLYDPATFPRRGKALLANAKYVADVGPSPDGKAAPKTLSEFAAAYVTRRSVCVGYAATLVKRAEKFERYLGALALRDVLTEDCLNSFLAAIVGSGTPQTVNKYRQDLLTLWSAAADDDLADYPNRRRIRRERPEAVPIECFSADEVRLLLATAAKLPGAYANGVGRRHYWQAIIRFAWDTGLRRGDCWRFERAAVHADGTFRIVQHKTRKPIRRMLRPSTLAAVDLIRLAAPLAWPQEQWSFGFQFQRLVAESGVDRGSFRWLRRATGSHIEAIQPGGGHKALGNTPQVFGQHYDAQIAGDVLMPPTLDTLTA